MEPSQPAGNDQPAADGSSGDREITIPGSPELGPIGGAKPAGPIDQNRMRVIRPCKHSK